jgi:cytochrome c556
MRRDLQVDGSLTGILAPFKRFPGGCPPGNGYMTKRLPIIVFLAVSTAIATAGPDDVVRQRQFEMKAMSQAAKRLSEFFSGELPFDSVAFRQSAQDIVAFSGERLLGHFAMTVQAEGSQASELIASKRGKFEGMAHDLERYARRVADAAAAGKAMPPSMKMQGGEALIGGPFARNKMSDSDASSFSSEHAFHMMLQTCTACHAAFRVKR